jgi:hypothetical protein
MKRRWIVAFVTVALLAATATNAWATSWHLQNAPIPSGNHGVLNSVSCPAAAKCVAVGFFGPTADSSVALSLAEHWNGSTWARKTAPAPAGIEDPGLFGVSCATTTSCVAVGFGTNSTGHQLPIAELWNGTSWSGQTLPLPFGASDAQLLAVSCSAATACTAVGASESGGTSKTLAERWNGSGWTAQTTPNQAGAANTLLGVSCPTATACTAVGFGGVDINHVQALVEHWTGTKWILKPSTPPTGATSSELDGVSCTAALVCFAVGGYDVSESGPRKNLVGRSTSAGWTLAAAPAPSNAKSSRLFAVSCTSAQNCVATGVYSPTSGAGITTYPEYWNGSSWTPGTAVLLAAPIAALLGISCTSATVCTAVGQTTNSSNVEKPLVERYA